MADAVLAFMPGGCLFSIFRAFAGSTAGRPPTFSIRVPQCAECARGGKPSGRSPDYVARELTIRSHPRFAAALAAQRREAEHVRQAKKDGHIRS